MTISDILILSTCFVLSCCCSPLQKNNPKVNTPAGVFEGSLFTSRLGKTIYSFRGIRYAEPPIGDLRFKDPVPIEKYDGIYNATDDGPSCPQPSLIGPTSEDCLFLNVYTTQLYTKSNNARRPVIVFLHFGGFFAGGGVSYWAGPQYLMDQDVVLVTFNYRLGTLGFLSTGDKHAPGNYGMKDQVVLLTWVKRNIEAFGGDPNSVTLLGSSAGAWGTILHMLSPMSQGLFHKVISMSGAGPLGQWPLPSNQLEVAKIQAKLVGCPEDTSENLVKCLKSVPAEKFNDAVDGYRNWGLVWSPVIEGEYSTSKFLTEEPIRQVLDGRFQKVPIIIGQTKDELGYFAFDVINNKTLTDEVNRNFDEWAPVALVYEKNTEKSKQVSRAIRKFYLNDKPIDKSQLDNLSKLYSDSIIGFGVHRATKLLAQYSTKPVYSYCFSFQGRYSNYYLPGSNDTIPWGVAHIDDLLYVLHLSGGFPLFTKNSAPLEARMVDKMTTLYANFAKTGKPIPGPRNMFDYIQWQPFNLKDQKYMDIDEKMTVKEKLYQERFKFWEDLYPLSLYR